MGIDGNVRDQFSRVIFGTRVLVVHRFWLQLVLPLLSAPCWAQSPAILVGGWITSLCVSWMCSWPFHPCFWRSPLFRFWGGACRMLSWQLRLSSIPIYARVVRASVLSVKETRICLRFPRPWGSNMHILFRRILPNAVPPLIVQGTLGIATAILDAAALSFLGLGAQPPTPEWGTMLGPNVTRSLLHPIWSSSRA